MRYELDQSGKIEDTAKNTILCISNGRWYAVTITGKTKRQIQEIFRRHGQIRNFVLFTFCAGLASLFRRIPHLGSVTMDEEYTGKNFVIKKITLQMLEKTKHVPDIRFGRIGKKALAHNRAYVIGLGKLKAQWTVSLEELREIKETD